MTDDARVDQRRAMKLSILTLVLVAAFAFASTAQAQWVKAYKNGSGTAWCKAY